MEIITDLNAISDNCGFFETETGINSGFGCKHKGCGDSDLMQKINGEYCYFSESSKLSEIGFIALKLTTRKINCNKRLRKKFVKKARLIFSSKQDLKRFGLLRAGKCYSFTCPIAYEISFDTISHYENADEYAYIESEKEMPFGWGDDLMGIDKDLALELGIID